MTLDELKAEHSRLVTQLRLIAESQRAGVADAMTFDGVRYTHDEATALTRGAVYQIELQLEAAGVYA